MLHANFQIAADHLQKIHGALNVLDDSLKRDEANATANLAAAGASEAGAAAAEPPATRPRTLSFLAVPHGNSFGQKLSPASSTSSPNMVDVSADSAPDLRLPRSVSNDSLANRGRFPPHHTASGHGGQCGHRGNGHLAQ